MRRSSSVSSTYEDGMERSSSVLRPCPIYRSVMGRSSLVDNALLVVQAWRGSDQYQDYTLHTSEMWREQLSIQIMLFL